MIHQALDHLEEGVDLLLLGGDRTIALVHWCYFEVATGVRRQGRVGVAPEVEPLMVPPLIGRHPLHGDVLVGTILVELDRTATDVHRHHLALLHRLVEDGGTEVVLSQGEIWLEIRVEIL
jgi:hypothetical protein